MDGHWQRLGKLQDFKTGCQGSNDDGNLRWMIAIVCLARGGKAKHEIYATL